MSVRMKPSQVIESPEWGDAFLALQVQGVACQHRLYALDYHGGKTRYIYLVVPDGGEINALRRWYDTEQEMESVVIPWSDLARVRSIHQHVLDEALKEVVAEMS